METTCRERRDETGGVADQPDLPHVLRTGVVPKGLFEIQVCHGKNARTGSRTMDRSWTTWLAYIEAMDRSVYKD